MMSSVQNLRTPFWNVAVACVIALVGTSACNDSVAPGAPARLLEARFREADTVGGTFVDTTVVQVTDAHGVGVPNVTVNWTTHDGTLNSSSSVTNKNGDAQVVWTFSISPMTAVGTTAALLTATLANDSSLALAVTAEHGNPVPVKVNGDNQSGVGAATLLQPLTVRVVDQHGNPIVNHQVTWTTPRGLLSATATPGTTSTNTLYTQTASDGTTQAYLTLGTQAGPNNVTATMRSGLGYVYASDTTQVNLTFTETVTP